MKRVRITFDGSYHHVMNRGIQGEDIFPDSRSKAYFLDVMAEKCLSLKIRVFAYCLMDNHYHLVLQNTSGKVSEFMRQLNGQYGIYYRKRKGGKGYVFQDRFKSILIQEDRYLRMVVIYVLLNPVRGGSVKHVSDYRWSSIHEYYTGERSSIVDNEFVEHLFGTNEDLVQDIIEWQGDELPIIHTRFGDVLGGEAFVKSSLKKFDRRKRQTTSQRKRRKEYSLKSVEQVIRKFEEKYGLTIGKIDIASHHGSALRAELLVAFKDEAGLTYSNIIAYPIFKSLKYSSLGQLYKRSKTKLKR